MKKTVYLFLFLITLIHIDGYSQKKMENRKAKADTISVDSLEYELIIQDPGFDSWLATKPSKDFYSQQYYETRNRLYVSEWNHRFSTDQGSLLYDNYIDYNYTINYGPDLNYRLYYYFKYFEETNHIRLINFLR